MNWGILAGLGERSREVQEESRKRNTSLLSGASKLWGDIASSPNISEEGRKHAIGMRLLADTSDPSGKIPKEISDLTPIYKGIKPQVGGSWMGGETERQIPALQMPIQSTLDQGAAEVRLPATQLFSAPVPEPPPMARTEFFKSDARLRSEAEKAFRTKEDIQTEGAIRRERAQAQARAEFPVPRSDLSKSEVEIWQEQNPGKPISDYIALKQKSPNLGSYAQDTVTYKGKATDVLVDRDMQSPTKGHVFLPTATGLQDITGQTTHYQPPAATIQNIGASQPSAEMTPDISEALRRAISAINSPSRVMQVVGSANAMFSRGNVQGTKDFIRQIAVESEPVAVQQQIRGRREVLKALADINLALSQVPTNLIAGTIEDTIRKLGATTDPRYVQLGNRLRVLNQSYRRSMTGAQFSVPEAKEYASIFPSYLNTAPVNQAQIQSLIQAFDANDSVFWDNKLGPGWSDAAFISNLAPPVTPPNLGGQAGAGTIRFQDSEGVTWEIDASKWGEVQKRDPGAQRLN